MSSPTVSSLAVVSKDVEPIKETKSGKRVADTDPTPKAKKKKRGRRGGVRNKAFAHVVANLAMEPPVLRPGHGIPPVKFALMARDSVTVLQEFMSLKGAIAVMKLYDPVVNWESMAIKDVEKHLKVKPMKGFNTKPVLYAASGNHDSGGWAHISKKKNAKTGVVTVYPPKSKLLAQFALASKASAPFANNIFGFIPPKWATLSLAQDATSTPLSRAMSGVEGAAVVLEGHLVFLKNGPLDVGPSPLSMEHSMFFKLATPAGFPRRKVLLKALDRHSKFFAVPLMCCFFLHSYICICDF